MCQPKSSKTSQSNEDADVKSDKTPVNIASCSISNLPAQGWQCPICRSIWSPTTSGCPKCNAGTSPYPPSIAPTIPAYPPYNPWSPYVPPDYPVYEEITWVSTCDSCSTNSSKKDK